MIEGTHKETLHRTHGFLWYRQRRYRVTPGGFNAVKSLDDVRKILLLEGYRAEELDRDAPLPGQREAEQLGLFGTPGAQQTLF